MTAGSAAVDVLRHGWQDAASTFAPDVPQVAQLLQSRLEVAVASGGLDERHLLEAIAEVEAAASRAGSPAGELLVRRLRRTVYEYLLALDAAPTPDSLLDNGQPGSTPAGPMVGAEEIAALRHAAHQAQGAPRLHIATADDPAPSPGWQPRVSPAEEGAEQPAAPLVPPRDVVVAPRSGFHIVEDTHPTTVPHGPEESRLTMPAFAADEIPAGPVEHQDAMDVFMTVPPAAVAAVPEPEAEAYPTVIDQDPVVAHPSTTAVPVAEVYPPEFQAWRAAISDAALAREELALAEKAAAMQPPVPAAPPAAPPLPPAAPAPAPMTSAPPALEPQPDEPGPDAGWRVREQTASTGGAARDTAVHRVTAPPVSDEDPFETNPRLAEMRQRIEDRLRRKRCDEAAALLQEIAQAAGGRIVAELAMNAGDRCRALGKTNAALSCYLAASRADPLFDRPLVQLADICIDDQDTDLAVTYLERVAQLYRLRGDDKSALRMYRRIVTIAPYREDMLATLMTAQSTGRFDS